MLRPKMQRHSSGQSEIAISSAQTLTSEMNRDQRRRASGVDRNTWAAQIQQKRNATAGDAVVRAGAGLRPDQRGVIEEQPFVIGAADSEKNTCAAAVQRAGRAPAVPHGFPAHFENEALLGIDARRFARRNSKKYRIEQIRAVDEAAPAAIHFLGRLRIEIEIRVRIPAVRGNRGNRVYTVVKQFPIFRSGAHATRKTTIS